MGRCTRLGHRIKQSGFYGRSKGEGLAIIGHEGAVIEPVRLSKWFAD
jgi:hypothetical protein